MFDWRASRTQAPAVTHFDGPDVHSLPLPPYGEAAAAAAYPMLPLDGAERVEKKVTWSDVALPLASPAPSMPSPGRTTALPLHRRRGQQASAPVGFGERSRTWLERNRTYLYSVAGVAAACGVVVLIGKFGFHVGASGQSSQSAGAAASLAGSYLVTGALRSTGCAVNGTDVCNSVLAGDWWVVGTPGHYGLNDTRGGVAAPLAATQDHAYLAYLPPVPSPDGETYGTGCAMAAQLALHLVPASGGIVGNATVHYTPVAPTCAPSNQTLFAALAACHCDYGWEGQRRTPTTSR